MLRPFNSFPHPHRSTRKVLGLFPRGHSLEMPPRFDLRLPPAFDVRLPLPPKNKSGKSIHIDCQLPPNQTKSTDQSRTKVALAEYYNVTEGRYVCANSGNCTSPGVCECAAGWSGFDCRTPICSQARQLKILGVAPCFAGSAIPPMDVRWQQ